ncbi:unnamed protein product [Cylindrotheca closterium]|uniref:Uncharacterized protein n=1 Tax=Cylindrotheca closterium TaxID=2856 RepID=A0AAD2CPE9_9STRA|nr:unnamed protein product [Cylindrotheca closterium]
MLRGILNPPGPTNDEEATHSGQDCHAINKVEVKYKRAQKHPCVFCKAPHSFAECSLLKSMEYLKGVAIWNQQHIKQEVTARCQVFPDQLERTLKTGQPDYQLGCC